MVVVPMVDRLEQSIHITLFNAYILFSLADLGNVPNISLVKVLH